MESDYSEMLDFIVHFYSFMSSMIDFINWSILWHIISWFGSIKGYSTLYARKIGTFVVELVTCISLEIFIQFCS